MLSYKQLVFLEKYWAREIQDLKGFVSLGNEINRHKTYKEFLAEVQKELEHYESNNNIPR